jgi:uncharacterized LabA/DUF88 family protein
MDAENHLLAVLIDADNAQASIIEELLGEISKIGTATVKRIYGDFTSPALAPWRDSLLTYSIHPIQQFRNTVGKNASDSAMIIDAMDLLHSKRFDGICIVSSDSDFTRLASRIREEGVKVYGFGEQKTPKSFVAACDRFTYTEILRQPVQATKPANGKSATPVAVSQAIKNVDADLLRILKDAVESSADDTGWAFLGAIGNLLNRQPDFDPRNYGHKKLGSLFEASKFEMKNRGVDGGPKLVYVRAKVDQ